jgi:hypothetical protein
MILLGIKDLEQRWKYTRQGIHKKQKQDSNFPKPIAKINAGRTQVFLLEDIVKYESKHRELTDESYKQWYQVKWCYDQKDK